MRKPRAGRALSKARRRGRNRMHELLLVEENQRILRRHFALEEAAKREPLAALEALPRVGWWAKLRERLGL